jgi:hypothetical protein
LATTSAIQSARARGAAGLEQKIGRGGRAAERRDDGDAERKAKLEIDR